MFILNLDGGKRYKRNGINITMRKTFEKQKFCAYDEYILFGSLPYTVTEPDAPAKRDYLEMVANTVITRDMIDRYDIRN
ncbi:MAG: hypothetical protein GX217_02285 [Clostridiaceae bacterium]|nr:hypothetical protein [Clostridiaceae bacterium]